MGHAQSMFMFADEVNVQTVRCAPCSLREKCNILPAPGSRWLHPRRPWRKPQRLVIRPRLFGNLRAVCAVARHASPWCCCVSRSRRQSNADDGASRRHGQRSHALYARRQLPEQGGQDQRGPNGQRQHHNLPHSPRQNPRAEGNFRCVSLWTPLPTVDNCNNLQASGPKSPTARTTCTPSATLNSEPCYAYAMCMLCVCYVYVSAAALGHVIGFVPRFAWC